MHLVIENKDDDSIMKACHLVSSKMIQNTVTKFNENE
jgi:hypothetical protein